MSATNDVTAGKHVSEHLPAYVNGTLAPVERTAVGAHLEHCPACATDLAAWEAIRTATLRSTPAAPTGTAVLDYLVLAIDHQDVPVMPENDRAWIGVSRALSPAGQPAAHGAEAIGQATKTGRLQWVLAASAMAALVVVTLVTGYVAVSRSHPAHQRGQLVSIPAVDVDPTTHAGTTTFDTVFATSLPSDVIPDTGVLHLTFWRLALDPGASVPASPEGSCCRGPQITHVLAGELTVQGDGPMQVFRGTDQALTSNEAPGTEVVLLPGDTVIHDFSVAAEYAIQGTTPAQIVNAGLYTGTLPAPWAKTMRYLDGSEEFHQAPLPAGPVAVSLIRATLPPDGEFPAPPPGSLVLEVGESSDASVGKRGDGSLFNINDTAETIYIVIVEPEGTPSLLP